MNIDNLSIIELFELHNKIGFEIITRPVFFIPTVIIFVIALIYIAK